MKPVYFKESNKVFGKPADMTDEECGSLHVYYEPESTRIISKWNLSFKERLSVLFFGTVWVTVHSHSLPPFALDATETIFNPSNLEVKRKRARNWGTIIGKCMSILVCSLIGYLVLSFIGMSWSLENWSETSVILLGLWVAYCVYVTLFKKKPNSDA